MHAAVIISTTTTVKRASGAKEKHSHLVDDPSNPHGQVGTLGLSVCYDLRFSELYLAYRQHAEADVLLVPSAFTATTGRAHWLPLLRARAIETQWCVPFASL
jgi:predicted amidohydrolase